MEEKGKPPFLEGYKEGPHSLISGDNTGDAYHWARSLFLILVQLYSILSDLFPVGPFSLFQWEKRYKYFWKIFLLQTRCSRWSSSSTCQWHSSTCSTPSAGGRSTLTWARWPTWPCRSRPRTWRSGTARIATSRMATAPSRCRSLRRRALWQRTMRQICKMKENVRRFWEFQLFTFYANINSSWLILKVVLSLTNTWRWAGRGHGST